MRIHRLVAVISIWGCCLALGAGCLYQDDILIPEPDLDGETSSIEMNEDQARNIRGTPLNVPYVATVTPVPAGYQSFPGLYVSPSIDGQILTSEVIVHGILDSVQASTRAVDSSGEQSTQYRALHSLTVRTLEYLKGSGPSILNVVVRGSTIFDNSADALVEAQAALDARDTVWDEREAIFFLTGSSTASDSESARSLIRSPKNVSQGAVFEFAHSNPGVQGDWDYTIETLSRAWLPSVSVTETSGRVANTNGDRLFIIEMGAPALAVELSALRQQIADWNEAIVAGSGIAGHTDCLYYTVLSERHRRAVPLEEIEGGALEDSVSMGSGSYSGDVTWRHEDYSGIPEYNKYWLKGPEEAYFESLLVDDDSLSSNGYEQIVSLRRPLVERMYVVHEYLQPFVAIPCNFYEPDLYVEWSVEVTAPAGTLHEAFFDPVALSGGGVGATGSSGVIDPDEFTVGSDDIEIDGLEWRSGSVVLELDDYVSLSGQTLDFIELDGSIDTSLDIADATVNQTAATWTWSVASQPWDDGDLLMLRVRDSSVTPPPPPPPATPTPTPTATPIPPTATADTDCHTDTAHTDT